MLRDFFEGKEYINATWLFWTKRCVSMSRGYLEEEKNGATNFYNGTSTER
jgi:hypothetical protein